ncbi:DNA-directed RNA polymerase subunit beta [Rummeliibacillus sp. G93]|uniref:DNA-directed RNA polymerase subunit beta n=1 Tax=Rummeliibacillus sp. G93 TaxID=2939494 RepID=UPI00201BE8BE|nr:DNA-directed RNA polymerase subunit beta [Rummeliibacillus sp. G93]UQW97770.1 DNA-directed RNA polymerase subunit beta [Rummeliibacillus sp. G93]
MANNTTEQKTENPTRAAKTRKEAKQQKQAVVGERDGNWVTRGILSIGIRILIVVVLLAIAVIAGAMIGYGVIGDGNPFGVFKPETWEHVFDLMNGK